jgi:pimeloyl-ACP methyl ester carboxylesterase
VHYLEAGERETGQPTVLFLHGAKFAAADWQAAGTFDALAMLPMHAVAPDAPGFGQVLPHARSPPERADGVARAHQTTWRRGRRRRPERSW